MNSSLIWKYQSRWMEDFSRIKTILYAALANLPVDIEHVGSTAVPGLAAKPVIDIDLIYQEPVEFDVIRTGLEDLGYYHNGDQGIAGREAFKRHNREQRDPVLDIIEHHLYVCHSSNEELHRHLLFRDYLRVNEHARNRYEQLKYAIALEAGQDRKKYAEIKEAKARGFILSVIEEAKKQRMKQGLSPDSVKS